MSELLFECYNVPSVAYGIDSLFSLYNNMPSSGQLIQCCHGRRLYVVILLSSELSRVHPHKFFTSMFLSQKKTQTLLMAYHGQKKVAVGFSDLLQFCPSMPCLMFFHVLSSIFYCETHNTVNTRKTILQNVIVL